MSVLKRASYAGLVGDNVVINVSSTLLVLAQAP